MTNTRSAGLRARKALLTLAVSSLLVTAAARAAPDAGSVEPVVVTAARMSTPLTVETDPKAPRQPLPAHDGADYLKTIPGFSVIRKGGADGDPVFRGMAASRVGMLMDGETVLGGCGQRMDPPTAYVFPSAYDRIIVIKGPQTVVNGPGNSAATVRFEREAPDFGAPGHRLAAAATVAGSGRREVVADLSLGDATYDGRLTVAHARSFDYTDGAGRDIHSAYERSSGNVALGWRPAGGSRIELAAARSAGEAAYADRAMDGVRFDRDNLALRFAMEDVGPRVRSVDGLAYYNRVDHVMDNFSLRDFTPTAMMPGRAVSNPDRRTEGARVAIELSIAERLAGTVGVDAQRNEHRLRSTMNEDMSPYRSAARLHDASFQQWGIFGEFVLATVAGNRAIAGARADRWEATDARETLQLGMAGTVPNPTAGAARGESLVSGFARYEHPLGRATVYAGAGYVERFPDYWELMGGGREAVDSLSAFTTPPERTAQLDVGVMLAGRDLTASLSAFASRVEDFILIESGYLKGMRQTSVTRSVKASTWGAEGDLAYAFSPRWTLTGTMAWTRGDNETDGLPLAQVPPLEGRLGLAFRSGAWSAGALVRAVASQDRVAVNQGNVAGQDIGPSPAFTVISLNAGYRVLKGLALTAGVDNLFDRDYAEHISRAGATVPGFEQTARVNEPGRTLWVNLAAEF